MVKHWEDKKKFFFFDYNKEKVITYEEGNIISINNKVYDSVNIGTIKKNNQNNNQ